MNASKQARGSLQRSCLLTVHLDDGVLDLDLLDWGATAENKIERECAVSCGGLMDIYTEK